MFKATQQLQGTTEAAGPPYLWTGQHAAARPTGKILKRIFSAGARFFLCD